MSQIKFYATHADLLDLLNEFESRREVHYAEAGIFDCDTVRIYQTAAEIHNLGIIEAPTPHLGHIFLMGDADTQFSMRTVPQRRGAAKFALDQRDNQDTVSLVPGGQFDDQTVVAGNFGTCTDSSTSLALFDLAKLLAKKRWSKIKSYVVGPQAETILDAGGRLTPGLRPEFDLRRQERE